MKKKSLAIVLGIVGIVCIIAGCSLNKNASGTNGSIDKATASSLDYFDISYDGELLGLTEEGLKQKVLVIPESVSSIGNGAFAPKYFNEGISNDVLEKVIFLNPDCEFSSYIFQACTALKEVILPDNLTKIPNGTFSECEGLESIVIPDMVTSIEKWAFNECTSLKTIEFGSSLISIDDLAFDECTSLTTLKFNDGLETIGENAFRWSYSIKSVTIPESVNYIDPRAFNNAFAESGTVKVYVKKDSWADINFDSYKTLSENVQKVYY